MNRLSDLINSERHRFETMHNNMFAFVFSQFREYHRMLLLIYGRYRKASEQYLANTRAFRRSLQPGTHPLTAEQQRQQAIGEELSLTLRLEVESFYLLAKILLDRVARAVEFYFGPASKLSLDSHDDLTGKLALYCEVKGLVLPDGLLAQAERLKERISDFRDYQIAHEKSPRTFRGWTYDDSGRVRMVLGRVYPTDKDQQQETAHLDELLEEVERFVDTVIDFVENNREKTALKSQTREETREPASK